MRLSTGEVIGVADNKDRFHKVLAIAINPGAPEGEATAALNRARELVRKDPSLAHPAPKLPTAAPPDHVISNIKVTNIPHLWLSILLSSVSEQAYDLGLMIRMSCNFNEPLISVDIKCSGQNKAHELLETYLKRLIVIINKPPET